MQIRLKLDGLYTDLLLGWYSSIHKHVMPMKFLTRYQKEHILSFFTLLCKGTAAMHQAIVLNIFLIHRCMLKDRGRP